MARIGYIPEKITVVLKDAKESQGDGRPHSHWSFPPSNRVTKGFGTYTAQAAFVVPSDSAKSLEAAKNWGAGNVHSWQKHAPEDPYEVKAGIPNDPMHGLRWVGIDSRSEGGVAYKVVTPQGWLVDLREDVFIECLYAGCIKGGIRGDNGVGTYLDGEFIWVRMGSQNRIVKVGTSLHGEMKEATKRSTLTKIPLKDLEAGGIYENKAGSRVVVLGRVTGRGVLIYSMGKDDPCRKPDATPEEEFADFLKRFKKEGGHHVGNYWRLNFTKSSSYVQKLGTVETPYGMVDKHVKWVESQEGRMR